MPIINGETKIIGIFGHPVKHSLSPAMHNAAIEALGINYVYVPFDVPPQKLKDAVQFLRTAHNIAGVNVTIPHKEAVISLLDEITDEAKTMGAVNTIIVRNEKLVGDNTDGKGFIRSLTPSIHHTETPSRSAANTDIHIDPQENILKGKNVFVCGAGGAARAIIASLARCGVQTLFLFDVQADKARECARTNAAIRVIQQSEITSILSSVSLAINATPLGMENNDTRIPFAVEELSNDAVVYDVVYNRTTALVSSARQRNLHCIDGAEMLLYQGAFAFTAWTTMPAPVDVMRAALYKHLRRTP